MKIGKWAFVVGILLAIFSAFIQTSYMTTLLIGLGLVVGFLNITEEEVEKFLIATIAMLVIGTTSFSALIVSGSYANNVQVILNNFVSFVSAAAIVVALKAVISLGDDEKKK